MTKKVIRHFQVTPESLIPVTPDQMPPPPRHITYIEGEPPPDMQEQMTAMREAGVANIPVETGWLTTTIQEFDESDADYQRVLSIAPKMIGDMKRQDPAMYERFQQGGGFHPAKTLAQMREKLGGDEGFWDAPQVRFPVPVSLAEWAEADPETTRLIITFNLLLTRDDLKIPS